METSERVICTDCSKLIRIPKSELPRGLRTDEVFERYCLSCEQRRYMRLDERDPDQGEQPTTE